MTDKIYQLLKQLLSQTRTGKLRWDYFADEQIIRSDVGTGMVKLRKLPLGAYRLILLDDEAKEIETVSLGEETNMQKTASELYEFVTTSIRGKKTGKLLDDMLVALAK